VSPVQVRIFTEPQQGATYDDLVAVARESEALGFDAFFRSDHYLRMGEVSGLPGPTDAWITLAGLARDTSTIRLGTLVTAATFRLPGPLAIAVAQVDAMSGGRVELGLGTGWYTDEHNAYGIPFPDLNGLFERFEEQLAIITGLWSTLPGSTFSFDGSHYQLRDSPALPKPVQTPLPVLVGGYGPRRTPRLAATYAQEFNVPFPPVEVFERQVAHVRAACEARDRDPATMTFSVALLACVGSDDAEFERRAATIGRSTDDLRANAAAGKPGEAVERIRAYAAAGASRVYLQILDLADLEHLQLIAAEVSPHLS
jgi:F420-dependent oxidoreductase-like protein